MDEGLIAEKKDPPGRDFSTGIPTAETNIPPTAIIVLETEWRRT